MCAIAILVNGKNPYLTAYTRRKDISLVVVTGHQDGSLYKLENF